MGQPSTADGGRLSYAIFTLARAHRGFAAALLRDLGLHPGQELLLMQLLDRDGQTQSELLDRVGLDHSTVSKSLRRMQEAGLVTRVPSERDRRVLHVWLTGKGRAMREPLTALWSTLERASTRGLGPDEIDAFIRLAGAVEHAIAHRASLEET
ncbi:MarR family winged helix-turn-helix transcriptional regulator [Saccharothrix sp. S26]|uniref:MarR family winged helix-turn-helix transcriptional regulator n=1 Tax=Saccharothrix sp. S26 TaxID=2907215 RepID=UPI001F36D5A6|nr:MarR family winged helix-turn-helix transcriptional regulator [Saccharothrix sp. S26]MCE6995204.1 MarR family winged helix-turn-helix transcriptional regulator [Saccharothrix sp. S26]